MLLRNRIRKIVQQLAVFAWVMACIPGLGLAQNTTSRPAILPLQEIRPGMKGIGKTVFNGNQIEEFGVEILGVLENVAPRQSIILGRLSGGPLARTGVMAGMSGSPVYIDGRLAGAVALAFQFSTEPIAGITPIEQMIESFEDSGRAEPGTNTLAARLEKDAGGEPRLVASDTLNLLPSAEEMRHELLWGGAEGSLTSVATPLSFSGFTADAVEAFRSDLKAMNIIAVQGGGSSTSAREQSDEPANLQPGAMISVQLVRGDMGVNADGTVTMVDGNRIYAFGHRFLSAGPTEIPFSESKVIALLPTLVTSMKISSPGRPLGVIRQDRSSGIYGQLGEKARMIPITMEIVSSQQVRRTYHLEVVNDRSLMPFLVNMTVFSAIGATERMVGDSTFQVEQTISLSGLPEVKLENFVSGSANAAVAAARFATQPLAYLMQSGLGNVNIQNINLKISSLDQRRAQDLEQVWSDKQEIKPGGILQLIASLRNQDGQETMQTLELTLPGGLPPGPLTITVGDGTALDRIESGRPGRAAPPTDAQQLVRAINKSRRNDRLYVLLSRFEQGYVLQGETLPSLPPSVARTLAGDPSLSTNVTRTFLAPVANYEMPALASMVTGSKSITVMVTD